VGNGSDRRATNENIIWRMRFACWITKATYTHAQYIIRIAFPRQQWLRECALMLRTLPGLLAVRVNNAAKLLVS